MAKTPGNFGAAQGAAAGGCLARSRGRVTGPLAVADLQRLIRRGGLGRSDEISTDGGASWTAAGEFAELFGGPYSLGAAPVVTAPSQRVADVPATSPGGGSSAAGPNVYFRQNDQTTGPIPLDRALALARAGQLLPDAVVWQAGGTSSRPAREHPLLASIDWPPSANAYDDDAPRGSGTIVVLCVIVALLLGGLIGGGLWWWKSNNANNTTASTTAPATPPAPSATIAQPMQPQPAVPVMTTRPAPAVPPTTPATPPTTAPLAGTLPPSAAVTPPNAATPPNVTATPAADAEPAPFTPIPKPPAAATASPGAIPQTLPPGMQGQLPNGMPATLPPGMSAANLPPCMTPPANIPPGMIPPGAANPALAAGAPQVVTRVNDDAMLAQTVGLVVNGGAVAAGQGVSELPVSTGSCFAVSPDGFLITNNHVVELDPGIPDQFRRRGLNFKPVIWVFFGKTKLVAQTVFASPKNDLAILRVQRQQPFFRMNGSGVVNRGTEVVALGFPGLGREPLSAEEFRRKKVIESQRHANVAEYFNERDFEFTLTRGTVSRMVSDIDGTHWIQHEAVVRHGNSGGPLVTPDGLVIGVNTRLQKNNENDVQTNNSFEISQFRQLIDRYVTTGVWVGAAAAPAAPAIPPGVVPPPPPQQQQK